MTRKEDPEAPHTAEIYVRVGVFDIGVRLRMLRYIAIDHSLEIITRRAEGIPYHIGTDTVTVVRISAAVIFTAVYRFGRNVRQRAAHDIGIIVDTVAVGIEVAFDIAKAEVHSIMHARDLMYGKRDQNCRKHRRRDSDRNEQLLFFCADMRLLHSVRTFLFPPTWAKTFPSLWKTLWLNARYPHLGRISEEKYPFRALISCARAVENPRGSSFVHIEQMSLSIGK